MASFLRNLIAVTVVVSQLVLHCTSFKVDLAVRQQDFENGKKILSLTCYYDEQESGNFVFLLRNGVIITTYDHIIDRQLQNRSAVQFSSGVNSFELQINATRADDGLYQCCNFKTVEGANREITVSLALDTCSEKKVDIQHQYPSKMQPKPDVTMMTSDTPGQLNYTIRTTPGSLNDTMRIIPGRLNDTMRTTPGSLNVTEIVTDGQDSYLQYIALPCIPIFLLIIIFMCKKQCKRHQKGFAIRYRSTTGNARAPAQMTGASTFPATSKVCLNIFRLFHFNDDRIANFKHFKKYSIFFHFFLKKTLLG